MTSNTTRPIGDFRRPAFNDEAEINSHVSQILRKHSKQIAGSGNASRSTLIPIAPEGRGS